MPATDSQWASCSDGIERPSHYSRFPIDPMTFCMLNDLPAWAMQVIKYACRAPHKGKEKDDIRKAIRFCQMRLEQIRRCEDGTISDVVGRPL